MTHHEGIPPINWGGFDIPFIGKWRSKIGRIIQINATPCSPVIEVWVFAFFQQIPFFFYTLTVPDCESALVDTTRKAGHRRRRRLKMKGAKAIRGTPDGPGFGWRVWRIYDFKEGVGFFFTIVDASLDLQINWMSTAYAMTGCPVPTPQQATWGTPGGPSAHMLGTEYTFFGMHLNDGNTLPADESSFVVVNQINVIVSCDILCVPGPFQPLTTSITVQLRGPDDHVFGEGTGNPGDEGHNASKFVVPLYGHPFDPSHYTWWIKAGTSGIWYLEGNRQVSVISGKWSNPIPCGDTVAKIWPRHGTEGSGPP